MLVHLRHLRADLALPAIQLGAIALALRLGPGPGSLAALAVLLGTGLFGTMRALRHARLIADTPTARIASAAQGYTELRAVARRSTAPRCCRRSMRCRCCGTGW